MEFIKKTVKQITTTGATAPCSYRDPETGYLITGCTASTATIVPDLNANYYFMISLTEHAEDIGFLDAFVPVVPPLSDTYDDDSGRIITLNELPTQL